MERGDQGYQVGSYMFNIIAAELVFVGSFLAALLGRPSPPWGLLLYGGMALMVLMPFAFFPFSKTLFLAFDLIFRPATRAELDPGPRRRRPRSREPDARRHAARRPGRQGPGQETGEIGVLALPFRTEAGNDACRAGRLHDERDVRRRLTLPDLGAAAERPRPSFLVRVGPLDHGAPEPIGSPRRRARRSSAAAKPWRV